MYQGMNQGLNHSVNHRITPAKAHRATLFKRGTVRTIRHVGLTGLLLIATAASSQTANSEWVGMSSERLARIGPVVTSEVAKGTVPGAVTLIARDGKIVHFEAHGFLDNNKTKPMPKEAVFRAYSMTKPFVSVATMMLMEEGRLQMGDPISKWMPELKEMMVATTQRDASGTVTVETLVPARREITVQDLLRHTSGFVYSGSASVKSVGEAYVKVDIESREKDLSANEFISTLGKIPLASQPGTHWEYSISTDVLGIVLERVTGKRLDHLLDAMLFKPLGMKDTSFQAQSRDLGRLADAFDADPLKKAVWDSARIEKDPGLRYLRGGAGAVTTAYDYFLFLQMIANGGEFKGQRFLSKKVVEYMLSDHSQGTTGSPVASTGPGYGFGLGFAVRRQDGLGVAPGSTGDAMWAGAGGTSFTIDPKERIVGVIMTAGPGTRGYTRMMFKNLIYGAVIK
jgi:CubicO group peptidase (beta-lactamase class C family)